MTPAELANSVRTASPTSAGGLIGAYYYIDDILLSPLPESGPSQSYVCGNVVPTRLGTAALPPQTGATYSWASSPNDPNFDASIANPTVQPSRTTSYVLTVTVNGQSYPSLYAATITVTHPKAGPAQALTCPGLATLQVQCPSPGVTYRWTNNATNQVVGTGSSPTVTVPYTTTFTLSATTSSGAALPVGTPNTTTVTVPFFPINTPPARDIACGGSTILQVPNPCPGVVYSWTYAPNVPPVTGTFITVTPTAPSTTYTLTGTLNGVALPLAIPFTVTVNNGQPCCPGHNYANNGTYVNRTGGQPYELGRPGVLTTITPADFNGSGPNTFRGEYHVRGPLVFTNGAFYLEPGTVFYADGGIRRRYPRVTSGADCYPAVLNGGDPYLQIFVGKNALFSLQGATLTADCDEMWGGVELVENGILRTAAAPATGAESTISEARVGVLTGAACRSSQAQYHLTGTRFINNTYGVAVEGNDRRMAPTECEISGCTFSSNPRSRLLPDNGAYLGRAALDGDYTRTGLVLHGAWHDGITYANNTFVNLYQGAEVAGSNEEVRLQDNTFYRNYAAAVVVGDPSGNTGKAGQGVGVVVVAGNEMVLPNAALPGGQVRAGAPVRGIQVLALPLGGRQLRIEANNVEGQANPGTPGKVKIGLDAQLSFDSHYVQRQNRFTYLDTGIQLLDAAANTSQEDFVTDNYFGNNTRSVVLTGDQFAPYSPAVSCNTFEGGTQGIAIEANAQVGYLAGPENPALPFGFEPCANNFSGLAEDVRHDGNLSLYYVRLDNSTNPNSPTNAIEQPNIISGVGQVFPIPTYGTSCADRPLQTYGAGQFGLNNRPGAGTSPNWREWEEIITKNQVEAGKIYELTLRLISYREKNGQLPQLEAFGAGLILQNMVAFDRISLYLMERYRRLGQVADARRVRTRLFDQRGQNVQVGSRIAYFDVAGRLTKLAPGSRPAAADSIVLAQVANSESGFAPVACATLRYFYPACSCSQNKGMGTGVGAIQRPAGNRQAGRSRPVQLQAYPNPAHDRLTVQLTGPCPAGTRVELVEMSTGRVVLTTAVVEARAELAVAGLAAGVYAGRAVGTAGEVLGICKAVVIH